MQEPTQQPTETVVVPEPTQTKMLPYTEIYVDNHVIEFPDAVCAASGIEFVQTGKKTMQYTRAGMELDVFFFLKINQDKTNLMQYYPRTDCPEGRSYIIEKDKSKYVRAFFLDGVWKIKYNKRFRKVNMQSRNPLLFHDHGPRDAYYLKNVKDVLGPDFVPVVVKSEEDSDLDKSSSDDEDRVSEKQVKIVSKKRARLTQEAASHVSLDAYKINCCIQILTHSELNEHTAKSLLILLKQT